MSPDTKHKIKLSSVLKSKLLTIAPTSQFNDVAASFAVRAELFKTSTFNEASKLLRTLTTFCTDSLSNKSSIQPKIVTKFELIISYTLLFIYV